MDRETLKRKFHLTDKDIVRLEQQSCIACTKKISLDDFKDEASFVEFLKSKICQKCQDEFFEKDGDFFGDYEEEDL